MKKSTKKNLGIIGLALVGGAAFSVGAFGMEKASAETAFDTASIQMIKGASVRYYSKATTAAESGIRFSSAIKSDVYAALEGMETDGAKVSYGMVIAPYTYFQANEFNAATVFGVGGDKKYTWDGDTSENPAQYTKIAHVTYDTLTMSKQKGYEDCYEIKGSLVKILDQNLTKEFVGRGYIKYETSEGAVSYKFADFHEGSVENNVRSIVYVSQLAIDANDEASVWVNNNYVSKVAGQPTTYTLETYVGEELVKTEKLDTTIDASVENVAVAQYQGFENVEAEVEGKAYANGRLTLKHVYEKQEDSIYEVKNGGFETGDLTDWTLVGNIGAVSNETNYWRNDSLSADGFAFGLDGTYMFSAYAIDGLEGNKGTLKSSTFTVSQSGWITYKLGGAKNATYVHVDVVEAATGNILKRYYNQNHKYEEVNGVRLGCELNAYKADLSDCIGKEVYLRVSDYASADFGLFFLDSVDTLLLAEPQNGFTLANEVAHEATIYDLYNGNFDKDMDGWTKTSNIGDISEDKTYWAEGKSFNNEGKYFSCYAPDQAEGATGTLTSNVFEIGGCGWITFHLGGVKNPDQVYMEVIDAVTGVKYGHFYNEFMRACELIRYKADLSAYIGKLVYIKFVDNATGDYGLIFCDEFVTYYANAADVPEFNVAVNKVESIYNVMNGSFEAGLLGWTYAEGSGEFGFLTDKECYWSRGDLGFNRDGNWVYTGVEVEGRGHVEGNTGILRSNTFLVKPNSTLCFKLGGARWDGTHRTDVGVRLRMADGTLIGEYYNVDGYNGDQTCIMIDYSIDLNNAEEMACYIEVFDNATGNWGLLSVDNFYVYQK